MTMLFSRYVAWSNCQVLGALRPMITMSDARHFMFANLWYSASNFLQLVIMSAILWNVVLISTVNLKDQCRFAEKISRHLCAWISDPDGVMAAHRTSKAFNSVILRATASSSWLAGAELPPALQGISRTCTQISHVWSGDRYLAQLQSANILQCNG